MPAALKPVSKTVNGTSTGYYLDGNTILTEKTNGVNTAQYTWGDGLIRCNGEYPMEDGRGNVRFTTDGSKTVTSANVPTAFGVGSVTSGTASAFSWNAKSGYRQDSVAPTGISSAYSFQKVGDRYYDPALMCFLTRDTELGQLPYTYCGGDPVNCTDPDGHKTRLLPPGTPQTDNGSGAGGPGSSAPSPGGSGGGNAGTGGGSGGGSAGTGSGTGSGGNVVADPGAGTLGVQNGSGEYGVTGMTAGKGPSGGYLTGTASSGQSTIQGTATAGAGAKPGFSSSYSYSLGGIFSIGIDSSGMVFFHAGNR